MAGKPKYKVRTSFHEEESIYDNRKNYPVFLGNGVGARLLPRENSDHPHILVELLFEDDGCWNKIGSMSNYWIQDLEIVLDAVKKHLKKYGKKTDYGYDAKGRF